MANLAQVIIHYDGTNKGPIYLKDIGSRNQLGGGKGIYVHGQDRYIDYGTDMTLLATSDVMMSASVTDRTGVIKTHWDTGTFAVEYVDSTAG